MTGSPLGPAPRPAILSRAGSPLCRAGVRALRFVSQVAAGLLALTAPALAGQLWVVDAAGGAGHDFTQLSAAVAAAGEGDTLLVRAGVYGDAVVFDKGLRIVARTAGTPPVGEAVVVRGLSVRGLQAGKHVLLSGLTFTGDEAALSLKNNAGGVWIEDCAGLGAKGVGLVAAPNFHKAGHPGLVAENCAEVVVLRSTFTGGEGHDGFVFPTLDTGAGGAGAELREVVRAVVHGSELTGGRGGNTDNDDDWWPGQPGGHGLVLDQSTALVMGSTLRGGAGGQGGEEYDLIFGTTTCGDGGAGGSGVAVTGSTLETSANVFLPGAGGPPFGGSDCSFGPDGLPFTFSVATLTDLGAAAFALELPASASPGDAVAVEVGGPWQSPAWMWVAPAPALAAPLPGIVGDPLVAAGGGVLVPLGKAPTTFALTVPPLPVAALPQWFFAQSVGFDALGTGGLVLGEAQALVVVPPGS